MTLSQLPSTVVYHGWRYRCDPLEPRRVQWTASKGSSLISSSTEQGIRNKIREIEETLEDLTP